MQVLADPTTGIWSATLPGGLTAWDVTLIASEVPSPGNTSEMSPHYTAPLYQVFLPLVLRNDPSPGRDPHFAQPRPPGCRRPW